MRDQPQHLLIVDDDSEIRNLLAEQLIQKGYRVSTAVDGAQMHQLLKSTEMDLIILDINLPGKDGFTLCREVRAMLPTPIIMLTARGDASDRITGLEMGADDYLPKPFEPGELLARIRSVLRRMPPPVGKKDISEARRAVFDKWTLDLKHRQLIDPQLRIVVLSGAEFNLLKLFIENANVILSREQLIVAGPGAAHDAGGRAIDIQISRIRQKFGDDARAAKLIKSVRGQGYVLAAEVEFFR